MEPSIDLSALQTEARNPKSTTIDKSSTLELCEIICDEDATVPQVVRNCIPIIAEAIDALQLRIRRGGKLIYVGAGTSGRLGVLDASELPPTYSVSPQQFIGLIAGGDIALRHAQEGAEDNLVAAEEDLKAVEIDGDRDSLIGIAASGRTPYVLRCLAYAKSLGCATVGISCSSPSAMGQSGDVDFMINAVTGPEVITGSTRMKAGTATKLILNILSTGVMIKIGKTFGNMMVDLRATNLKLKQRSRNILRMFCGPRCPGSDEQLDRLLELCGGSVKIAIASLELGVSAAEASERLAISDGILAKALEKSLPMNENGGGRDSIATKQYVLCVDGGASKCAAVIIGPNGEIGTGESSGCNVTDLDTRSSISAICRSVQGAVNMCATLRGITFSSIPFSNIWIGLAGIDRPKTSARITDELMITFNRTEHPRIRVTTDIELLAAVVSAKYQVDSAIVLLAGTGSIAMRFVRDGDRFMRTGRIGGWGHLLGDQGSGYDIGRQGLQFALQVMDEIKLQSYCGVPVKRIDALAQRIFDHFRPNDQPTLEYDLYSAVIAPGADSDRDGSTKKRIADVARIVVDASSVCPMARSIMDSAIKTLVDMLGSLVSNQKTDHRNSVLVLAGGLMKSEVYRRALIERLSSRGLEFDNTEIVLEPALTGAHFLTKDLHTHASM